MDSEEGDTVAITDGRNFGFFMIANDIVAQYGPYIGPYGIAVYNALAWYAGRKMHAWPSYQTIADQIGMSRRKVIYVIDQLVTLGLVKKHQRVNDNGDPSSNLYTLSDAPPAPLRASHAPPDAPQTLAGGASQTPPSALNAPEQYSVNNTEILEQESAKAASPRATASGKKKRAKKEEQSAFDFVTEAASSPNSAAPPSPSVRFSASPLTPGVAASDVYRKIFKLRPNDVQMKEIANKVKDISLWEKVCTEWRMEGHRPTNVRGILDWYENGGRMNGGRMNGNGYQPPMSKVAGSMAAIAEVRAMMEEQGLFK